MPGKRCGAVMPRPATSLALAAFLASLLPAGAVTVDPDRRQPAAPMSAIGRVQCGSGQGAAQLVGSGQVIVTAAHVLFGSGGLRAGPEQCRFEVFVQGQRVTAGIEVSTIIAGTQTPYAHPASYDWAVARLQAPIAGARPLGMGGGAQAGQGVTMVSGRTLSRSGTAMAETCAVRATRQAEGGRELMIDCSGEAGDSGAAVLDRSGGLVGVYVGFRSSSPGSALPFGETHYNFALPLSGQMRAAIRKLAR
jgi:hypothetical protein